MTLATVAAMAISTLVLIAMVATSVLRCSRGYACSGSGTEKRRLVWVFIP